MVICNGIKVATATQVAVSNNKSLTLTSYHIAHASGKILNSLFWCLVRKYW